MAYITNESQIIEMANMFDVMGYYNIKLNSRGKSPCPIHDGEHNNFSVKDNIATCFSQCATTWGPISFIRKIEGCDYPSALERLGEIMNIDIKYDKNINREEYLKQRNEAQARRELLYGMTARITEYFHHYARPPLKEHESSTIILDGRAFSESTIEDFKVFYLKEKSAFANAAKKEEWDVKTLRELFLLREGNYGEYAHFRKRIMFPIFTDKGEIAGWSGRKFRNDTSDSPKYFNSMQSFIYNKDELLYGLYHGKQAIRKKGFAYIVEGNTDVLTLYDNDVRNVVAPCGTALTDNQARLLKRYTDSALLMYDGDDAGLDAMKRNIGPLLKKGFRVSIVILPEGEDPDSYMRTLGPDKFKQAVDDNTHDAIMYLIKKDFDPTDAYQVQARFDYATKVLSHIDDDLVRDTYINNLCTKELFGSKKRNFQTRINETRAKTHPSERSISIDQQESILRYGIYEENNMYFYKNISTEGEAIAISNFVIRPIMLIKDTADTQAARLFEIINYRDEKSLLRVDSDSFVEMTGFKKSVEAKGDFVFWGRPEQFIAIKKKIYAEMKDCFPILTYGRHPAGFWAWGNGIYKDGEFNKVNEYGIVSDGKNKFFLPAFSKVNKMTWDSDDSFEFERSFIYASGITYGFTEWSQLMLRVFPEKAPIAVTFYVASLFRDIIFNKHRFFPHLNMFGAPGSGKSYLGWALMSMFGRPLKPFHLKEGTNVAFARVLSRSRNALAWFDEYKNDIHPRRIEQLKGAYDGAGREKGVMSNDNRTKRDNVNSALLVSGQHQPTADPALFERVISLNFQARQFDREAGNELEEFIDTGRGSQISAWLQRFREDIKKKWDIEHDKQITRLKMMMDDGKYVGVKDRYIRNYAILLTVYNILSDAGVEWGFDESHLYEEVKKHIILQVGNMRAQDETNVFWDIVQYLMASYDLQHGTDYVLKTGLNTVTVKNELTGQYEVLEWDIEKPILALRMTKTIALYRKEHRQQTNSIALSKNEVLHYLRQKEEYIGHSKAQRFGDNTYSCYLFNYTAMDVDLPQQERPLGLRDNENPFKKQHDKTPF